MESIAKVLREMQLVKAQVKDEALRDRLLSKLEQELKRAAGQGELDLDKAPAKK